MRFAFKSKRVFVSTGASNRPRRSNVNTSLMLSAALIALLTFASTGFSAASAQSPIKSCEAPEDSDDRPIISAGVYQLGSNDHYAEERPLVRVEINSFNIDRFEVTNAQFARFVEETGYVTAAEKGLSAEDIPGLPPELQVPGSMVFVAPTSAKNVISGSWWQFTPGANWRQPEGPGSSIKGQDNYPVVHVTAADAEAYAAWAGRALPTEAQWEAAAHSQQQDVPLQDQRGNHWQGAFPLFNSEEDGFIGRAPVGCFSANANGAYDMVGNVWELTATPYMPSHERADGAPVPREGRDPNQPGVPVRVIKGGSFLCAKNFCARYRPTSRQAQDVLLAASHIGFRTVSRTPVDEDRSQ